MSIISHGTDNDQNIIVQAGYDRGGRMVSLRHPDGRQDALRYDQLNRRTTHVRGWVPQATDPAAWVWSGANSRWEDGGGSPIAHGTNDQNLVTRLAHRLSSLSTPGGAETLLTDAMGQDTIRRFDPLGRLSQIDYGNPASSNTPNVGFEYDLAGNRTAMSEYSDAAMSQLQRRTAFEYDQARRLNKVEFDTDGDSVVEQTVSYSYDRGGQRTTLTIDEGGTPLTISYQYDAKGQLIGLSDWDSQATSFEYDNAGRHTATRRANNLDSSYRYDRANRLKELRHEDGSTTFARFRYTVDGRGNRIRAVEALRTGDGQVVTPGSSPDVVYLGNWTGDTTSDPKAILRVPFASDQITLEMGEGPNYSLYGVYIDGALWGTLDGYSASSGTRQIAIALNDPGSHVLELRNRSLHSWRARNAAGFNPADYTMRFISLTETGEYDVHDIAYTYDALSRLQQADYDDGATIYDYGYDVAGNLLNNNGITRTYNAVNQLTSDGTYSLSYDRNGNLINDGSRTYVWDQANRLVEINPIGHGTQYRYGYDGVGNRIQQSSDSPTMGPEPITRYLLDMQPGLTQVLGASTWYNVVPHVFPGGTPSQVNHYIHALRGIHAMDDGVAWTYAVQDGLGSVRSEVDNTLTLQAMRHFDPIGNSFGSQGNFGLPYQFTGEIRDWNGWQYHRARYYSPDLGVFSSLDPFEGVMDRPMSLNGYSWVEGNVVNAVDPSGKCISEELSDDTYHLAIKFNSGYCAFTPQFTSSMQGQRLPCRAGGGIGNIRGGWQFWQGTNGCDFPNMAWIAYVTPGPATVQIQARLQAQDENGIRFNFEDIEAPFSVLTDVAIGQAFAAAPPNAGITNFVICSDVNVSTFFGTISIAIGGCAPNYESAQLFSRIWREILQSIFGISSSSSLS